MPGRAPRRKGDRIEREIVALHRERGVKAERVPLSGAAGGSFSGDVDVYACGDVLANAVANAATTSAFAAFGV